MTLLEPSLRTELRVISSLLVLIGSGAATFLTIYLAFGVSAGIPGQYQSHAVALAGLIAGIIIFVGGLHVSDYLDPNDT